MTIKVPASAIIYENGHRFIDGRYTGLRTLSGLQVCMNCGAIHRADGNAPCCEAHVGAAHDAHKAPVVAGPVAAAA